MRRALFLLAAITGLAGPASAEGADRWSADDIRRELADWLRASGREVPPLANIGPLDPRLSLPACDKLQIVPRGTAGSTFNVRCEGPSPWQQVLRVDNLPPAAVTASRVPEPSTPGLFRVVVPKVDIPAGSILSASDLEERTLTTPPGATAIRSASEIVGLRLLSSVSPGVALTTRHVGRAPSILKGENVTLVANGSGFEISVPGRAEQDGYEGDVINVRNIRSGATLKGRIERGKTVTVLQL